MKKRLMKLLYIVLLFIHLGVVFVLPLLPWVFAVSLHLMWLNIVGMMLFLFIQVPIMIYASTKETSIIDKLIHKIKDYS